MLDDDNLLQQLVESVSRIEGGLQDILEAVEHVDQKMTAFQRRALKVAK